MSITCCAGETRGAGKARATSVACSKGQYPLNLASPSLISSVSFQYAQKEDVHM